MNIKLDDIPEWSEDEQREAEEARKKQRELEKNLMKDYKFEFTSREFKIIDIVVERIGKDLSDVDDYLKDARDKMDDMLSAISNAEECLKVTPAHDDIETMEKHVNEVLEERELKKRLKDFENEIKDPNYE